MGVISSFPWLEGVAKNTSARQISTLLGHENGGISINDLYAAGLRPLDQISESFLTSWIEKDHEAFVNIYFQELCLRWGQQDCPLYVLPTDENNARLQTLFHGGTGQFYPSCQALFLFLPTSISKQHVKALIVHEYHHFCRWHYQTCIEDTEALICLERMMMEGLAEEAVHREVTNYKGAPWAKNFIRINAEEMLSRLTPWIGKQAHSIQCEQLMYGSKRNGPYFGYNAGRIMVETYYQVHEWNVQQSFKIQAKTIFDWFK
ncbi:DUF2268 domain-containing putative Zn-dependent protease [Aureibacillus halotolerans]|uniref:Uncharacterized protein YjaZ n=1 Tax=Aureibacillus halotolerans TaxID=1508390 RepID=A0A4R6U8Q3_9BACI|nr:DUF2268 domain-containing putative Zn-dependent protease [Aureibacillus halotolerans]TDQ42122.1 uncharacterized protein YjaZ [Aureibacillus halotolerans]